MDAPKTEAEAQAHIASIRRAKGPDGLETNSSDLENALIILSEQLYQKSTHFLSELIQNADDNTYEIVTPTLHITFNYNTSTLRIDCNEVGFGRSNVEAICKIGRSTKAGLGNTSRYIGEKGIGFKSVFKVADVIWIASGHYSFKFDKNATLGMIAPIWCDFPDTLPSGNTSILLQLSDDYDSTELEYELKSLDPRLLIFLRKLKQINITSIGTYGMNWRTALTCHDALPEADGANIINLRQDDGLSSFKVIQLPILDMPNDAKRQGCTASEILLAFPVDPGGGPCIAPQKVYAFLPIRDHGFKFLLQADFLLVASRGDIDGSSVWNRRLLTAIPEAFLLAVQMFNKGSLRYSWIKYLSGRPPLSDFFEHLESGIFQSLARADVLEASTESMTRPQQLKFVSPELCDDRGIPLSQSEENGSKYLSQNYAADDENTLYRLGVEPLSIYDFLQDLRSSILRNPGLFRSRSGAWHSSFSRALLHVTQCDPQIKNEILRLPIVPLKDGRWVAPGKQQICFVSPAQDLKIPKDIPIGEIDTNAESDRSRRNLFILLGAKTFSKDLVCDAILRKHKSSVPDLSGLKVEDLVSHAVFLFKAEWKNRENGIIWVATSDVSIKRASKTYVDSVQSLSAKVLCGAKATQLAFLHPSYFSAELSTNSAWIRWLEEQLHVAKYPRLIASLSPTLVFEKDFLILLDDEDPIKLLLLLRDRWEHYSKFFVPSKISDQNKDVDVDVAVEGPRTRRQLKVIIQDENWHSVVEASKTQLRENVACISVSCRGGKKIPLKQSVLPLEELGSNSKEENNFLDVPEPDRSGWKYLRHFGVVVEPGLAHFVRCLRQLKETTASLERVSKIYEQIYNNNSTSWAEIKKTFQTNELIFIPLPSGSGGTWVRSTSCVWKGPTWLRKTHCLYEFYPQHLMFMCIILKVENASQETFIDEVKSLLPSDNIDYISEVLIAINGCIPDVEGNRDPASSAAIAKALKDVVFPINSGESHSAFDRLRSADDLDLWFIADRMHLRQSFEGLVPLLALNINTIEKINSLIDVLRLKNRLLSHSAESKTETIGRLRLHTTFTASLRAKTRHIARIIPKNLDNRRSVISQLSNASVYTAEQVVVQWCIKARERTLTGRADSGRVRFSNKGGVLNIYLRQKDADAAHAPFELREYLTDLCGIRDSVYIRLLDFLLLEHDLDEIDKEFSRRGIPNSVPELDDKTGANNAIPSSSYPNIGDPKRFCGGKRKTYRRWPQAEVSDSNDSNLMQSFIQKFNLADTLKDRVERTWTDAEAENMLGHLCRLENISPWGLLSQDRGFTNELLRSARQAPGSVTAMHWNTWREVHDKHNLPRTKNSFPATVYQDSQRLLQISVSAGFQNMVSDDILFAAEFYVSRLLEEHLGAAYNPDVNWTSSLRSKAGFTPFSEDDDLDVSTFTILDTAGQFSGFLARHGFKKAASWRPFPTYHIEVIPSEGNLNERFCVDPAQVYKAWECTLVRRRSPSDVYIMARVVDVRSNPQVALFVDPWQLHANGLLTLSSMSQYEASFSSHTPALWFKEPEAMEFGTKFHKSFKKFFRKKQPPIRTSPSTCSYHYETLQFEETRLLELLPGDEKSPLSGHVTRISLGEMSSYYALSYAWGPAMKPFQLQTTQGNIPITASLEAALRRLRKDGESIYVWVDAVCINQNDNHEKAIQIRMLPKIFQSAKQVLAWIGEEMDKSSRAIETLLQIRTLEISPSEWPDILPDIPQDWRNGVPDSNDEVWWAIQDLFQRDWFFRVWVIQEVVLATDVTMVCGTWELDWDDIVKAIEICVEQDVSELPADSNLVRVLPALRPAYTLGITRRLSEDTRLSNRFNLLHLLDIFSYAKSSKDCDKLFALLGIACDSNDTALDPDYSSSLEDIVHRYAAEFVRRGKTVDLLYRSGTDKSYNFCSWIPRWTAQEARKTISTWRGAEGIFSAGGAMPSEMRIIDKDSKCLLVTGRQVDTITKITEASLRSRDVITLVNEAHTLIDSLESYPTGQSLAAVKLKVPIGNAVAPCSDDTAMIEDILIEDTDSEQGEALDDAFDWKENHTPVYSIRDMVHWMGQPNQKRRNGWNYWTTAAAFLRRLSDGRFFVTEGGYVGVGPHDAKVGDCVYVLHGAAVPFLLKRKGTEGKGMGKKKDEGERAVLVGEAYVHGMMYGEALQGDDVRKEQIVLS